MRIQAVPIVRTRVARAAAMSMRFTDNDILDPRVTFTRASQATHFDSTGRLVTDANDVARFDYDPVTLQPRGLLIEESRTNLLLHSRDMTQAAWSKTDVTANRNQVGIDGSANSACLMTDGTLLTANVVQTGAAVTAGSSITASVCVKRGNNDWIRLRVLDNAFANGADAWFNLNTGAKGSLVAIGTGTGNSSTIAALGGGWYRCAVTSTPNGSYTVPIFQWSMVNADSSSTRVSGATYIVDCAQLEVGAFATSIINTGAATATRAADSASMTGANFSSWFNASQGSLVVEYVSPSNTTIGILAELKPSGSGSFSDRINILKSNSANPRIQIFEAGVNQLDTTAVFNIAAGAVVKAALAYASGSNAGVANGGTVQTSANTYTPTTYAELQIGNTNNSVFGPAASNAYIRSIRYYNQRLPNATLQALTA